MEHREKPHNICRGIRLAVRVAGRRVRIDRSMRHIKFKATVFPRPVGIPREHPRSLFALLPVPLDSRFCATATVAAAAAAAAEAAERYFTSGNILPISLSMQISIRERQYLLNRAEKGF